MRKSKAKNLKQRKQHRKKEQRTNKTRIPYVGRPNQTLPSAKAQRCDANERQIGFAHPSSHLSVYQKPIGRPIGLPLADCIQPGRLAVRRVAQPLIGLPVADWAYSSYRWPTKTNRLTGGRCHIIFEINLNDVIFLKFTKKV